MAKFVERPQTSREKYASTKDLLDTATNGKAIVIQLDGTRLERIQNALRSRLREHGFTFHYKAHGNALLAWVTPKPKPTP